MKKPRPKYHRQYCPLPLIDAAIEAGWTRELALFVILKRHLSHGWFRTLSEGYNRLPRSIGKQGLSYATFTRYIKVLRAEGLVYKENGVYKILSRKKIKENFKTAISNTVVLRKYDGVRDCRYLLLHKVKERMAQQQVYRISARKLTDKDNPGLKTCVSRRGTGTKKRFDSPIYDTLARVAVFTHNHIAEKLHISKSESVRLNKFAVERKMCRSRKATEKILWCGTFESFRKHERHLSVIYGHVFYRGGFAVRVIGLEHESRNYWIAQRPRTRAKDSGNERRRSEVALTGSERTFVVKTSSTVQI